MGVCSCLGASSAVSVEVDRDEDATMKKLKIYVENIEVVG